jgi:hypothetical protein
MGGLNGILRIYLAYLQQSEHRVQVLACMREELLVNGKKKPHRCSGRLDLAAREEKISHDRRSNRQQNRKTYVKNESSTSFTNSENILELLGWLCRARSVCDTFPMQTAAYCQGALGQGNLQSARSR